MLDHGWAEAHAVVRFAEARVAGSPNKLVNRCAVAVRAVEISPLVEAESEGVDLTAAPDLDP